MSTDFRALCAELLDELVARPLYWQPARALIDRARAALSEPADGPAAVAGEPSPTQTPAKGPTRQELRQLFRDQSGYIDDKQVMWIDDFCAASNVVLARWGNLKAGLTSPPAEGEVAELVAWVHAQYGGLGRRAILNRIAELLQRQAAPVPVPVTERLPGPADCVPHPRTQLGNWCWGFETSEVSLARPARWRLMHMESIELEACHWLPATALPVPPAGEVEPDA